MIEWHCLWLVEDCGLGDLCVGVFVTHGLINYEKQQTKPSSSLETGKKTVSK